MGRTEEIRDAQVKTFRLPAILVGQLEAAARLRGTNVSDAVRDILERSVRAYYEDSHKIYVRNAQAAITAIQEDAELRELYDRCKGREELSLPYHVMRDEKRVQMLSAALGGYKALETTEDEANALFADESSPTEKEISRKLLSDLAGSAKKNFRKFLLDLEDVVNTGDLVLSRTPDGSIEFRFSKILYLLIFKNHGLAAIYRDKISKLIANGHLVQPQEDNGICVFLWR